LFISFFIKEISILWTARMEGMERFLEVPEKVSIKKKLE
jgi:hypothetical protein